jgi:hypothetical protein
MGEETSSFVDITVGLEGLATFVAVFVGSVVFT